MPESRPDPALPDPAMPAPALAATLPEAAPAVAAASPPPARDRDTRRGVLWMLGCLASFLLMAIASRELSRDLSVFQIQFFRSLAGLVLLVLLVRGLFAQLRQRIDLRRQMLRNIVHFAAGSCWTLGIAVLPLADVVALEFTIPIWVALFAWLMLGERPGAVRLAGIALGFAGVLVILQPGAQAVHPVALVVLLSAVGYGISNVMVKQLTATSTPVMIVAWMVVLQLPMGGIAAVLTDWRPVTVAQLPWMALLGLTGLSAHYTMAQALRVMEASVAIPIDFFRVPLTALVGFALYAEPLRPAVFLGAAMMFVGNFGAMWLEARARRRA